MSAPGRELYANAAAGALEALIRTGEDLLGRAQRLAPVEEGTLRGSAALVVIVNGHRFEGEGSTALAVAAARTAALAGVPLRLDVEVSFNTVYAARQHEELDWAHPLGGQAKYLEQPLREQADRYGRIIELATRRAIQGTR